VVGRSDRLRGYGNEDRAALGLGSSSVQLMLSFIQNLPLRDTESNYPITPCHFVSVLVQAAPGSSVNFNDVPFILFQPAVC
jgi:hypothetical protein